jgi:hypothetical protein
MTINNYIDALPFDDEVKQQIKHNFDPNDHRLKDSLEDYMGDDIECFLQGAFIWGDTPEGHRYWSKKKQEEELWIQCGHSPK